MCGENENRNRRSCLANVLETILELQQNSVCDEIPEGCNRPFLGNYPGRNNLNTRPFNLYSCCNGEKLCFPYTVNGVTCEGAVFRIENLNDNCATCRILAPNNEVLANLEHAEYTATEDYFTINLNCCCAIKCLEDTNVCGV